jgi:SpoVK/Ycf46/Vps4 family AAA+-type ATPase
MDGLTVGKSTVVFMSTNNVCALAPSVCRPGRCDVKLYLGRMSASQIVSMTVGFFADMAQDAAAAFAAALVADARTPPTPAELQGYFLSCDGDPARVTASAAAAFFAEHVDASS